MSVVLTDYPKVEHIEAHMRGVSTEKLVSMRKQLFHTMMVATIEVAGGYAIHYDYRAIERELNFRNVQLEEL
jgi:hypothetical protein